MADAGDDEARWRELVEHFSAPAAAEGTPAPWPAREDVAGPAGAGEGGGEAADPRPASPADPVPGAIPAPPQLRIIRPASPVPLPAPGDGRPGDENADDEHYVPPVPPPLPRLEPAAKGAWVALFGGPGYLLVAVMVGWPVPGWAAFCAVAAFVGGFATLVMRMGDRPPHDDSDPDDGAVV